MALEWKSWFRRGFELAFVATLSAEFATQIDKTNWFYLPVLDRNTWASLGRILTYGFVVALFVSFVVGFLAACFALIFGPMVGPRRPRSSDATVRT